MYAFNPKLGDQEMVITCNLFNAEAAEQSQKFPQPTHKSSSKIYGPPEGIEFDVSTQSEVYS